MCVAPREIRSIWRGESMGFPSGHMRRGRESIATRGSKSEVEVIATPSLPEKRKLVESWLRISSTGVCAARAGRDEDVMKW